MRAMGPAHSQYGRMLLGSAGLQGSQYRLGHCVTRLGDVSSFFLNERRVQTVQLLRIQI
jgi:hypothetical protein